MRRGKRPPYSWFLGAYCMLSCFSHVWLFATPWTVAMEVQGQPPLSLGFSRQENWSELPCPPSGDLPNPGIKLASQCLLHWQSGSLPLAPPGKPDIAFLSLSSLCQVREVLCSPWGLSWHYGKIISGLCTIRVFHFEMSPLHKFLFLMCSESMS